MHTDSVFDPTFPTVIAQFLDAVNNRDSAAIALTLTEDVSYQLLVPYPATTGRDAVVAALKSSLDDADKVEWDVVSWSRRGDLVFVERVDRFFFGVNEAAIECLGVFTLREGQISIVRDYADLQTWRQRKSAATASE